MAYRNTFKPLQDFCCMHIVLINHPLVSLRGDVLGSGVPYMPVSLAYLAGYLRMKKHNVKVIDIFGEAPLQKRITKTQLIQGLTAKEVVERIPATAEVIFLYAGNVVAHNQLLEMIAYLKSAINIAVPVIVFENTQAVTAYSLTHIAHEFFNAGANAVLTGEAEIRIDALLNAIKQNKQNEENKGKLKIYETVDGLIWKKEGKIIYNKKIAFNEKLDELPFPAWDLLPIENYWKLGYSHGPLSSKKYLPILTSRGCPFPCAFCVIPDTNSKRWRARSPENIANEMEHYYKKWNVREYHLEDVNPTVLRHRMIELSQEIINRKLPVIWKISSGTKIETLNKETLTWMAKGGLKYLSFSPESGSPKILRLMKKPFHHELALELAEHMYKLGIKTQACFVLGFTGETKEDLELTKQYALKLAKAGVDEIALFIMTPIPGSAEWGQVKGFTELSQLTFSPTWRTDYKTLNKFRKKLYLKFHFKRAVYHPLRGIMQPFNILRHRFTTKTEMAVYRYLKSLF